MKKLKSEPKTKSAAILTIHDFSGMTPSGRKAIIKWLKSQIEFLEQYPKEFSKRFTARYLYEDKEKTK